MRQLTVIVIALAATSLLTLTFAALYLYSNSLAFLACFAICAGGFLGSLALLQRKGLL